MRISGLWVSMALGAVFLGGAALAQQETDTSPVAEQTDWYVFEETGPRECWTVSVPKEQVNTRDGRVVDVRRGQTLLMVFFRPGESIAGQVAFTGGYPIAQGSTVTLDIDGNRFELLPDGEWAWPAAEDDSRIVSAMRAGSRAVLTAVSSRGTQTQDSFSLLGFTATLAEAERRCS